MNLQWRETIPYEHFKDGDWNYDHNKHMEDLGEILRESRKNFSPNFSRKDVFFSSSKE